MAGELPADGEVQLGPVRLPAGRRIRAGTPAAEYNEPFLERVGFVAEFTAVLRSWEERFGAVLCEVGFASTRVLVTRPPRARRAAELVAAEIFTMCDEFWPIEHPGMAFKCVWEIADYLQDAPFWGFWWD